MKCACASPTLCLSVRPFGGFLLRLGFFIFSQRSTAFFSFVGLRRSSWASRARYFFIVVWLVSCGDRCVAEGLTIEVLRATARVMAPSRGGVVDMFGAGHNLTADVGRPMNVDSLFHLALSFATPIICASVRPAGTSWNMLPARLSSCCLFTASFTSLCSCIRRMCPSHLNRRCRIAATKSYERVRALASV